MNTVVNTKQFGAVILEALIAFLVLAVGVIAMIYLQGNLMEGNSISKARAEAVKLANNRMETLRNYIDKRQYLSALKSVPADDVVTGVNAIFRVCYNGIPVIPEDPTTDEVNQLLKVPVNLEVTVKWPGTEGLAVACNVSSSKDEEVTLETMLYFIKPEISSAINSQNNGNPSDPSNFRLPSPWLTGVEKAHESTEKFKNDEIAGHVEPNYLPPDNLELIIGIDESGIISTTNTEIQIITYYNSITGLSNVEVVHGTNDDGTPKVVLTSFGGIVHKLKGEIILQNDADTELDDIIENFRLLASPPSYCVAPICANGFCKIPLCKSDGSTDGGLCHNTTSETQYLSYVCYVPGDCTDGDADKDDTKGCPHPFNPPINKDLNGGWYGRIGNFNLFIDGEKDMVCTADTLIGGNPSDSNMTPSREYATHRWELDGTSKFIAGNEGINRSFDCNPDNISTNKNAFAQTFIIAGIVKNQPNKCLELAMQYHIDSKSVLTLPPEHVIRVVGQNGAIPGALDPSNLNNPSLYPPQPPYPEDTDQQLTDVMGPFTENNVVLEPFNDYCIPAPN